MGESGFTAASGKMPMDKTTNMVTGAAWRNCPEGLMPASWHGFLSRDGLRIWGLDPLKGAGGGGGGESSPRVA